MNTNHLFVGKKTITAVFVFFFSLFGSQLSYAEPGRSLAITIDALTYASENPTDLLSNPWWGGGPTKVYRTFGVRADDTLVFNILNASDNAGDFFDIVGYFNDNPGFAISFLKNAEPISYIPHQYEGIQGYFLDEDLSLNNYRLEVTFGSDPELQNVDSEIGSVAGFVGFPSTAEYFLWEIYSSGQWEGSLAPAPAAVSVRQSTNLSFAQSFLASDTLSDPDGELRTTLDQVMNKYGSLIK